MTFDRLWHGTRLAPTQQTTHGDTRGPKAGCPQTHNAPAHAFPATPTHGRAA